MRHAVTIPRTSPQATPSYSCLADAHLAACLLAPSGSLITVTWASRLAKQNSLAPLAQATLVKRAHLAVEITWPAYSTSKGFTLSTSWNTPWTTQQPHLAETHLLIRLQAPSTPMPAPLLPSLRRVPVGGWRRAATASTRLVTGAGVAAGNRLKREHLSWLIEKEGLLGHHPKHSQLLQTAWTARTAPTSVPRMPMGYRNTQRRTAGSTAVHSLIPLQQFMIPLQQFWICPWIPKTPHCPCSAPSCPRTNPDCIPPVLLILLSTGHLSRGEKTRICSIQLFPHPP